MSYYYKTASRGADSHGVGAFESIDAKLEPRLHVPLSPHGEERRCLA